LKMKISAVTLISFQRRTGYDKVQSSIRNQITNKKTYNASTFHIILVSVIFIFKSIVFL